jgi:hypothetical protein
MAADQGIMALPEAAQMQQPQLGLDDAYDAVRSGVQESLPEAAGMLQQGMDQILPNLQEMSDEDLDKLLQIVQYLSDNPDKYAQSVADLVQAGLVDEGDFPPEHDPEFLAALGAVILEARRSRGASQPQQFAQGGLASLGRGNDTMLAHINPQEARMLKRHGGMGTTNPKTGLPEYDFWSSLVKSVTSPFKGVVNAVKGVLKSPVGRILGTVALAAFLGPGAMGFAGLNLGALAMPLASGAVTALTGGKLKDVLKSAAVGYLAGPTSPITSAVSAGVGALAPGLSSAAQLGLSSGLAGTGVGLLSGQNLKQAVGSGLISGLGAYASSNPASAANIPGIERGMGYNAADSAALDAREAAMGAAQPASGQTGMTPGTGFNRTEWNNLMKEVNANQAVPPAGTLAAPAAGTPATAVPAAPGAYQPMGIMQGFEKEGVMGGLKNLFMPPSPTEAQILASPELKNYQALGFKGNELMSKTAEAMGAPGAVRTYAPAVAAGLGIMGLSGGFKKTPVQLNAGQQAMVDSIAAQRKKVEENPGAYTAKGLGRFGIQYNDKGEIVGSSPWSSPYSMNDVRVESNAISPYMMTPSAPLTAYRGYAQGGSVDESFFTDSDGQQVPISYGPPAPTEQPSVPAPTATPSTFTGGTAAPTTTNLIDPVGPPIQSFTPPTPQQQRDALQQRIDMEKTILGSAEFGTQKHTNALQALAGLRSQLTAQDYALAHPAGVMSAAQAAGMTQGQDLAKRMYPSLNPAAAAQMFPTVPRTTGRVPQPYNTSSMYSNLQPAPNRRRDSRMFAEGGIASLAQGGYPRMTGAINGPGTETSDSIPAMLSNNEFVFTAKAVRAAGGGSARQGAKRMYALMHQLERNAARG